jgi:hypothetical protein
VLAGDIASASETPGTSPAYLKSESGASGAAALSASTAVIAVRRIGSEGLPHHQLSSLNPFFYTKALDLDEPQLSASRY